MRTLVIVVLSVLFMSSAMAGAHDAHDAVMIHGVYLVRTELSTFQHGVDLSYDRSKYTLQVRTVCLNSQSLTVTEAEITRSGPVGALQPQFDQLTSLIEASLEIGVSDGRESKTHFLCIISREEPVRLQTKSVSFGVKVDSVIDDIIGSTQSPDEDKIIKLDGDLVSPIAVAFSDLVDDPEAYEGRRVGVEGYLIDDEEHFALYGSRFARWRTRDGIWLAEGCGESNLRGLSNRVRVIGVFRGGRSGHLGSFRGRLERITGVLVEDVTR